MPDVAAARPMLSRVALSVTCRAEHLMAMPAVDTGRYWTPDEVRELIDTEPFERYEVVHGELLVTPSPPSIHQRIIFEVAKPLDSYVRKHGLGEVRISPSDTRPIVDVLLQPDLFVIPAIDGRRAPMEDPITRVSLAIEVLSRSSERHDRVTKRRVFQEYGLADYWIIDPNAQTIECWHPGSDRPEMMDHDARWQPVGAAAPFVLNIPALFREVLD